MTGVQTLTVTADEADLRLDRWFKRRFPTLTHGRLEKLLRTGQIRVDGKRAASSLRVAPGAAIRVPPLPQAAAPPPAEPRPVSDKDARALQDAVLYKDDDMLAIDKPAGLAVQGGSKLDHHLDAMLDVLRFGAEDRPRLVHRLDRDTSGVLLLARNARAAAALAEAVGERRDVVLVASSDLSHYHPALVANRLDAVVVNDVGRFDPEALMLRLEASHEHACGGGPIVCVMRAARTLGAVDATVLKYGDSGDAGEGDKRRVVGYLAAALHGPP